MLRSLQRFAAWSSVQERLSTVPTSVTDLVATFVSGPSLRWKLLSQKGPPELPPGQAEELANLIPGTVPLRPGEQGR